MKILITFTLFTLSNFAFGQNKKDTLIYLEQKAKDYLETMYIKKDYDSAAKMWDDTFYREMTNFYAKRQQGHRTDTALFNKLKLDTRKYFKNLNQFKYQNILCPF